MIDLPLVSIITPSRNQAQFLEETICSVLSQDYPRIEYIVIDGGSTDGSVDIIRKYENRLAHWVSEPDRGQADAINKGWRMARGEVLAYLNSDDTYMPGAISTAVDFLLKNPDVGVVYSDCLAVDEEGRPLYTYGGKPYDLMEAVEQCITHVPQPSAFIRSVVIERAGLLDTELYMAMDFDFWLRVALYYRLQHVPGVMATYRLHSKSKTVSQGTATGPDLIRVCARFLQRPDCPEALRRRRRRVMSRAFARAAEEYYAAVQLSLARQMWLRAWLLYPLTFGAREYASILNTWLYPLRHRHSNLPVS